MMASKKNLPIFDWLQIDSSAPGKFIVSSEYSVVYGKQAIAAAIDLRTRVTIRPGQDDRVKLNLKDLGIERSWPTRALTTPRLVAKNSCIEYDPAMPNQLIHLLSVDYCSNPDDCYLLPASSSSQAGSSRQDQPSTSEASDKKRDLRKKAHDATMAFLLLYFGIGDAFGNSARVPIDVEVNSDLPVGSGLGSSSAYSAALCGALMKVYLASVEKHIISSWAFNIDKYFHGRPSGEDNNIVTVGGFLLFQNGKTKAHGVHHNFPIRVLLIETGVSRSTKTLSDKVINLMRSDQAGVNSIFSSINEMTTQIWCKLNDPDFKPPDIKSQLITNQRYLDQLGVGHMKLDEIIMVAKKYNFTAKQTGAGGGGTAFLLYDEDEDDEMLERLGRELTALGYSFHNNAMSCEGLIVKFTPDPEKQFQPTLLMT